MNYHAAQQHALNWCWAACIQMALSAKDIPVSQEEVVRQAFGSLADRPASGLAIVENLNGWGVTRSGKQILLTATPIPGPPQFSTLKFQLESGTPVIVALPNPDSSVGHAVVITAVVYEPTSVGAVIHRVLIRDPSPEYSGTLGKRELIPEELSQVDYHIIIIPAETSKRN